MSTPKCAAIGAAIAALSIPSDASAAARPVSLSDARVAPSYLRPLAPGASVTKACQCRGGSWRGVSAHRCNGRALAARTVSALLGARRPARHSWRTIRGDA